MDPYGSKQPRGHATTVLDLVSRDDQDNTLFPLSATISRFLTRDEGHRTIPFSSVMRECTFKGPAELGQRFLFELSDVNCGDLLQGLFIQIKMGDWLPDLIRSRLETGEYTYEYTSLDIWTYLNSLGTAILEEATLEVDDQILERITGDSVDVISRLFPDLNTQIGLADSLGKKTVAEVKAWTGSRALPTEDGWITVPLVFSILREKTTATFPLLACRAGTVRVGVTLKRFDQIVRKVSGTRGSCTDTPLGKKITLVPKGIKVSTLALIILPDYTAIKYSYDGIAWYTSPSSIISTVLDNERQYKSIAYNGRLWVAVITEDPIHAFSWSEDGIVWNFIRNTIGISSNTSILWDSNINIWVAYGGNSIVWSEDGKTWNTSSIDIEDFRIRSIVSDGTQFIAGGYVSTDPIAFRSTNGKEWYPIDTDAFNSIIYKIVTNGIIWIAFSEERISWSENGIDWTIATYDPGIQVSRFNRAIVWDRGKWISSSGMSGASLLYSLDGKYWRSIVTNPIHVVTALASNGSIWVSSGTSEFDSQLLAWSSDGIVWTLSTVYPFDMGSTNNIIWNGSVWVTDSKLYSLDGKEWYTTIDSSESIESWIALGSNRVPPFFLENSGSQLLEPLHTTSLVNIQTPQVPPPLKQIQLLTYGVFVDGPYREMLLRQPFERPFREIQQFDFTEPLKYLINKTANDTVVIQLPLEANQPIEEILWIVRRKAAITQNNDWTNYSATLEKDYDPIFCPLEPLVSYAKIQANGMDIVSQPEAWFRSHIARAHKAGKVAYDSFIYGYSFARHPGQHDPTGSMNASRLNSLRLTLDVKTPQATTSSSDTEWQVKVFVFAFQWVRFGNGICNKVFID